MTREQKYREQLKELGVYREAFEPEIHMLAMMEREIQRMDKAWRAEGSPAGSKTYAAITSLRRDILAHRDALGLTPKGLRRLRRAGAAEPEEKDSQATVLKLIQSRRRAET